MTNIVSAGWFRDRPFPASNLPASQQAWRVKVEKRLQAVGDVAASSQSEAARAVGRWSAYTGQIDTLSSRVDSAQSQAQSVAEVAYDSVTWSLDRPVSPADDGSVAGADVPRNPDATWFVYEDKRLADGRTERQVKETWRWVPPTYLDGDTSGEWVQQRFGTATLGSEAIDLSNLNKALSDNISEAAGAVDELKQSAQQALEAAQSAEQAAKEAKKAANDAAQGAGADGHTIVSPTEPQGADRKPGNLWINTANGKAEPYMFDAASDTWKPIDTQAARDAAQKALEADQKAQRALDAANSASDKALAAELAAQRAQQAANGKNRIFYTKDKPTLDGRVAGDMWFDTDDNYKAHIYDPAAQDFVVLEFGVDTSALEARVGEVEQKVEKAQQEALKSLEQALSATGEKRLFTGPFPLDEGDVGDYWIAPDGALYRLKRKKP